MIKIVDQKTYELIADTLDAPFVALLSQDVVPQLMREVGCTPEEFTELLRIKDHAEPGSTDCAVDFVHPNTEYQWAGLVMMLVRHLELIRKRQS